MANAMKRLLHQTMQRLDLMNHKLISPTTYVEREKIKVQAFARQLLQWNQFSLQARQHTLSKRAMQLAGYSPKIEVDALQLKVFSQQLNQHMTSHMATYAHLTESMRTRLELLSPEKILERGYAIISDKKGQIIRKPTRIPLNQPIHLRMASGQAQVQISHVQPELE